MKVDLKTCAKDSKLVFLNQCSWIRVSMSASVENFRDWKRPYFLMAIFLRTISCIVPMAPASQSNVLNPNRKGEKRFLILNQKRVWENGNINRMDDIWEIYVKNEQMKS